MVIATIVLCLRKHGIYHKRAPPLEALSLLFCLKKQNNPIEGVVAGVKEAWLKLLLRHNP